MLVLSRKKGEKIVIGDTILLSIIRVGATRVQIGIEAPAEVQVRREFWEQMPAPRRASAAGRAE